MTAGPGRGQSRTPGEGVAPARLRRLNRRLVQDLREDLAGLYVESRVPAPGNACRRPGRQDFLNAESDGLTGCAFGFPVRGDGSWWLGFDGVLPRGVGQLTVSGRAFAFGDILIRPHPQDRELARRVQKRLLTDHQASLGATLVDGGGPGGP